MKEGGQNADLKERPTFEQYYEGGGKKFPKSTIREMQKKKPRKGLATHGTLQMGFSLKAQGGGIRRGSLKTESRGGGKGNGDPPKRSSIW